MHLKIELIVICAHNLTTSVHVTQYGEFEDDKLSMNQCKKVITLSKMGVPPKLHRWQVKMVRLYQAELRQAALLDFDDLLVEVTLGTPQTHNTHTLIHAYIHTETERDRQTDKQTYRRTHTLTHKHTLTRLPTLILITRILHHPLNCDHSIRSKVIYKTKYIGRHPVRVNAISTHAHMQVLDKMFYISRLHVTHGRPSSCSRSRKSKPGETILLLCLLYSTHGFFTHGAQHH